LIFPSRNKVDEWKVDGRRLDIMEEWWLNVMGNAEEGGRSMCGRIGWI
jgi:hypothetical protein